MEKYTLHNLLNEYNVIIPQLQRDYAQGRNEKKEIREKFLTNLLSVLADEAPRELSLDFVYGYTDNTSSFYPLDGQQRLTTLWLLAWYLCPIEDIQKSKEWLAKFNYHTRISASRFCRLLVEQAGEIKSNATETTSGEAITEMPWFRATWHQDPTVKGMLTVLATIDKLTDGYDKDLLWKRLVNDERIVFSLFDINNEEFKLTDELYIKMNARGKELTAWECYKAELIGNLMKTYKDSMRQFEGKEITYSDYYAINIDSTDWTDLFWNSEDSIADMDNRLLCFHYNMAKLCYYSHHKEDDHFDFRDPSIWNSQDNFNFLIDTLSIFSDIAKKKDGINVFFRDLFSELKIFGKANLFDQAQKENIEVRQLILFFCLIQYMRKYKDGDPMDYLRICRNYLAHIWQRKETKFVSDIRLNNLQTYWKGRLEVLLESPDVYELSESISEHISEHEGDKAKIISNAHDATKSWIHKLEDHVFFLGNLRNLYLSNNIDKIVSYANAVYEIWEIDEEGNNRVSNSLISKAMIATGFNGIYIRSILSNTEDAILLGDRDWFRILTNEYTTEYTNAIDEMYMQPYLTQFLDSYIVAEGSSVEDKLQDIIDTKLKSLQGSDTRYYFLQYDNFTSYNYKNVLYYSNPQCFNARKLYSTSGNPTMAYHISPYVEQVVMRINNPEISDNGFNWSIGYEKSGIVLKLGQENDQEADKNQIEIKINEDGYWIVNLGDHNNEKYKDAVETVLEMHYPDWEKDEGYNYIVQCDTDDRIEIGRTLTQEIYDALRQLE